MAVSPIATVRWRDATLDHFSFDSNATFRQKFLVHDAHWRHNRSGPLLLYFGNEGAIEDFWNASGALFELAPPLNALVVALEHRYYGVSLPFGAKSLDSAHTLRYLSVEQALADMAEFLARKSELLGCAPGGCRTVLFGGSYGGMLSAWHRLKYPQLTVGAIAASAPVDLWPDEGRAAQFRNVTLGAFGAYGAPACATTLDRALRRLPALAATAPGRQILDRTLAPCAPLASAGDGGRLVLYFGGALATTAMLDYPYPQSFVAPLPANPVKVACDRVGGGGDDDALLRGLAAAADVLLNSTGSLRCHNVSRELMGGGRAPGGKLGVGGLGDGWARAWNWQACTELVLEPATSDGLGFWVERDDEVAALQAACRAQFGADLVSRPAWLPASLGDGVALVRALTNVVFSDGDKDPWRIGGVPANASAYGDGSVRHVLIRGAAHHQDLRFDDPRDPPSVGEAKAIERRAIEGWLGR